MLFDLGALLLSLELRSVTRFRFLGIWEKKMIKLKKYII